MASAGEVIRRQAGRGPQRFEAAPGDATMLAVVTTGNGDLDMLGGARCGGRSRTRARCSSGSWPPA